MNKSSPRAENCASRCEPDRLLLWLAEVLAASDRVEVQVVVEDVTDARSSVQITLRDVARPVSMLPLRKVL